MIFFTLFDKVSLLIKYIIIKLTIMKKTIIWIIWVVIWITPVLVAMIGNSPVLMLISLMWAVILYKFSVAYAPQWMLDVLKEVFV